MIAKTVKSVTLTFCDFEAEKEYRKTENRATKNLVLPDSTVYQIRNIDCPDSGFTDLSEDEINVLIQLLQEIKKEEL